MTAQPVAPTFADKVVTDPVVDVDDVDDDAGLVDELAAAAADVTDVDDGAPAPAVLTREEMRQRLRAALAADKITVEDIVVDVAAACYHAEQMLGDMARMVGQSRIGRKMMARAEKLAAQEGTDDAR